MMRVEERGLMPVNPWDAAMRGGWLHTRDHGSCAIEPRNIRASVWLARGSAHYQLQTEASLCDTLVAIASHCLSGAGVDEVDTIDAHVDVRATSSCISFTGPIASVEAAWERLVQLTSGNAELGTQSGGSAQRVSHTHHAPRHWLADAAVRTGITQWTAEALSLTNSHDDNTL